MSADKRTSKTDRAVRAPPKDVPPFLLLAAGAPLPPLITVPSPAALAGEPAHEGSAGVLIGGDVTSERVLQEAREGNALRHGRLLRRLDEVEGQARVDLCEGGGVHAEGSRHGLRSATPLRPEDEWPPPARDWSFPPSAAAHARRVHARHDTARRGTLRARTVPRSLRRRRTFPRSLG